MKAHINYQYNQETRNMDFLVNGEVKGSFSSKDVGYLTSLSRDEIYSGRCCDLADKMFGHDNYTLDYFINGNGYYVYNPSSDIE